MFLTGSPLIRLVSLASTMNSFVISTEHWIVRILVYYCFKSIDGVIGALITLAISFYMQLRFAEGEHLVRKEYLPLNDFRKAKLLESFHDGFKS
jgi:hypothetical protein